MSTPPPASGARRLRLKHVLLIALALTIVAFVLRNPILGKPVATYEAVRSDLVHTLVASGRVSTPQRIAVASSVTGRVTRIPVREGQEVEVGDVLIELDSRDERAAVAQAQAALAQAEAKQRQLRELGLPVAVQSLAQAEAQAAQARLQFERNTELKNKGFVSQAAVDEARRNLDVAESQLRSARIQVKSNSAAGSEVALAQAAIEQARAALAAARARLDETVIRAPAAGTLIGRSVERGNVVQSGKELMALAPVGETEIVVQIDERNLSLLQIGQKALASADAFPDQRFAAEVDYINPGIDASRGAVEVKLHVPDPPAYLRQDMTASVDIEVARRAAAIVVPADAVRDIGSAPWVLVVSDGRAQRREVKPGLRGDGRVEILQGIAPGDRLIPPAIGTVKAGDRVRTDPAQQPSGSM